MSMPQTKSKFRDYFESIVIAVVFALFVRAFVVQAFKIPTGSMEDNLLIGDHLLVNRFVYAAPTGTFLDRALPYRDVRGGEVVIFKFPVDPARDFVKRAIGLPKDALEIRNTQIIRNDVSIKEPYTVFKQYKDRVLPESEIRKRDYRPRMEVPDGYYFMMGDNRNNSEDSRYWGCVSRDLIKGRAVLIYWSFDAREGTANLRGFDKVKELFFVATRFFFKTRWRRTFDMIH